MKKLYMNVHSIIIHYTPKVETNQIVHKLMDGRQNVVYPYNWILSIKERKYCVSLRRDKNVLKLGVVVEHPCKCIKYHWIYTLNGQIGWHMNYVNKTVFKIPDRSGWTFKRMPDSSSLGRTLDCLLPSIGLDTPGKKTQGKSCQVKATPNWHVRAQFPGPSCLHSNSSSPIPSPWL